MEGGVHISTLFVLKMVFLVLPEEFLLFGGEFPYQDDGCSTGVGWPDKGGQTDKRKLNFCQDESMVAVMAPSMGTLDQLRVLGEETMGVLDGSVVQFPWLLGEGREQESVNYGVNR